MVTTDDGRQTTVIRLPSSVILLEVNIEENINNLNPKEKVLLWLELQKFIHVKLKRMKVDPFLERDPITKITFEVIHTEVKNPAT